MALSRPIPSPARWLQARLIWPESAAARIDFVSAYPFQGYATNLGRYGLNGCPFEGVRHGVRAPRVQRVHALRVKLRCFSHGSIFSKVGASSETGAIQFLHVVARRECKYFGDRQDH